jgi:hypothetical protein
MPVEHAKKADLWPLNFDIALVFRFQNVKNYADSVLVIVSDDSLICVGCI